jgi:hypothetical protein
MAFGLSGYVYAQSVTTVVSNGASSNRVDIIVIGDGYQSSEIETTYADDVDETIDSIFFDSSYDPYPRYKNFFNVHRVNIVSNESGADDPNLGTFVDTALDATYNSFGTDRCLYFDTSKANSAVNSALSGTSIDVDMRLGAVNSAKYGGCGGQWAVWAASNFFALDIAVHEVGHSFADLADEYYFEGTTFGGAEPFNVNATADLTLGKWDRWLGYDDPDTNIGPIDYYEGGRYHEFGIFRPSDNSMMRNLGRPLDAIGRERVIEEIYLEVQPLDCWSDETLEYTSADTVWVDTVDPAVINVEWFLDGVSLGIFGESLDIASLGLVQGEYTLEAFAYDAILDHSFTNNSLDWWRLADTSLLEQTISFDLKITLLILGDCNLDGAVDFLDISPFISVLSSGGYLEVADINADGEVGFLDISPFISLLSGQ